jgi:hypothetical protein
VKAVFSLTLSDLSLIAKLCNKNLLFEHFPDLLKIHTEKATLFNGQSAERGSGKTYHTHP